MLNKQLLINNKAEKDIKFYTSTYNIIDIARLLINICIDKNITLTITKLNKYLYIIYGSYLHTYKRQVSTEPPSCFQTGPIFKTIQRDYKKGILDFDKKYDLINLIEKDECLKDIIDKVLSYFSKYTAEELTDWTMREGFAWQKASDTSDYWGNEIPDSYIEKDFKKFIKTN